MLDLLLRLGAEFGPVAAWLAIFFAAVIAVFVLFVGIALRAVLNASDDSERQMRYQIFRDLLGLFSRGKQE